MKNDEKLKSRTRNELVIIFYKLYKFEPPGFVSKRRIIQDILMVGIIARLWRHTIKGDIATAKKAEAKESRDEK